MRSTGEKCKYELVTDYILTRNPSRGEIHKEFGVRVDVIKNYIQLVKNPSIEKHMKSILDRNSYRDLKGYEIYKYMILNPKVNFKSIQDKFGIKQKGHFKVVMSYLIKANPNLAAEVEALIKKVM